MGDTIVSNLLILELFQFSDSSVKQHNPYQPKCKDYRWNAAGLTNL